MEKQYAPSATEKKVSMKSKTTGEKNLKNLETKKSEDKKQEETKKEIQEEKKIEEKTEEKKEKVQQKKVKRDYAIVNGFSIPVSTKEARDVCSFIRGKKIKKAIEELEEVLKLRRAVPMKGEIPHRHGNIMAGRYPKNTSQEMIKLLKSLSANANFNEMDDPIIAEAIANKAQRPFGKGGRVKKKRSHIKLVAREKKEKKK